MDDKKQVKTISLRADADTLQLLEKVRFEFQKQSGFTVTNSDILRNALEQFAKQIIQK